MSNLKIRVFKKRESDPETTITIPGNILKIASKLIPHRLAEILQDKGIDIAEIIRLSENPEAKGTLVEIEEHKKNEKVVIALE
jgi:aspartokinase